MKFAPILLFSGLISIALSGCSLIPSAHKVPIQQGHIITTEMVSNLKLGMTKNQVRYVLGNSLLPNMFDEDRWDYHYSTRLGSTGDIKHHLYTVYFADGKLIKTEGDHTPDSSLFAKPKDLEKMVEDAKKANPLPEDQ